MTAITIVDYGMGNLGSLENMIRRVGGYPEISSSKDTIEKAEKLILPGVGSYAHAVQELQNKDLWNALNQKVKERKTPVLCICLGAQLVTEYSEEGNMKGFGWIKGKTLKFNSKMGIPIPHMGWNNVEIKKPSILFEEMYEQPRFYFVHSYYMTSDDEKDILTTTSYGGEFASSLEKDNIFAVQFHPEKSHKFGLKLFENFLKIDHVA